MRFTLIDRIDGWEQGKSLQAVKHLTLGEEYLGDHFPGFPVMPGVLMLQALVEAGAWLWRLTSDFRHSVIVLREVRNVKYASFMEPGRLLQLSVDLIKDEGNRWTLRGKGVSSAGSQTVAAQFVLAGYDLPERFCRGADLNARLRDHWRERFALLSDRFRQGEREINTERY